MDDGAQPSLTGRSNRCAGIRRVRDRADTRLQTEKRTERSSGLDIAGLESWSPRTKHIHEPVTERETITKAAIGGVLQMRVRINERGQQHGSAELFKLRIRERPKHLCSRTDCDDQTILYCNCTLP
jgi:hypothetical protein